MITITYTGENTVFEKETFVKTFSEPIDAAQTLTAIHSYANLELVSVDTDTDEERMSVWKILHNR